MKIDIETLQATSHSLGRGLSFALEELETVRAKQEELKTKVKQLTAYITAAERPLSQKGENVVRAIIIEDKDAQALVDKLTLEAIRTDHCNMENPDEPLTFSQMHRIFHYQVIKWLHDQGARIT